MSRRLSAVKMSEKVSTRTVDWRTLVNKQEGTRPKAYPTYQFSNGRQFKDRGAPGKVEK